MNAKANEWHPWKGATPITPRETLERYQGFVSRQTLRAALCRDLGGEPGKAEYRRIMGLPEPRRLER